MKKTLFYSLALVAIVVIAGLIFFNRAKKVEDSAQGTLWYEDMPALEADLAAAIEDAKVIEPSEVRELTPIKKGYPGQEWINENGRDMVLLITLVDTSRLRRFFGQEGVYSIDREFGTWVTIPTEWKKHKDAFSQLDSTAAHMRFLQMYGLSPDCDYNIMVSFYADPEWIFRPSFNPDITTTTPELKFPDFADENYVIGETNFREWYDYSVYAAYDDGSPLPWTQLGYTYDWHEGSDHVGLSEYIVSHMTPIKVKSYESEWEFLKNL